MADTSPTTSRHKVALVTGAGSGIGRAISATLAASGFMVALAGRNEAPLQETLTQIKGRGKVFVADIGDPKIACNLGDIVADELGSLDVIVNNAGLGIPARVGEATTQDIVSMYFANAIGPTVLVNGAWKALVKSASDHGRATVVNISSLATVDPFETLYGYAPTKGALNTLALAIRNAGRPHGIRAFSLALGAVETAMLRGIVDSRALPAERCLQPEAIAKVVLACINGEHDARNGDTIIVPSP
jgi:3-oxoacyl-[acyl-carrier protein] reductase